MPLGSRAAKIPSRERITIEYAPRTSESASAIAPSSVGALERAIRWRMTSESEVVVKSAPGLSRAVADLPGVDEVAVVGQRQRAAAGREDDRLGVDQERRARRRVPDVADGRPAGQPREPGLVEDVGDVAHLPLDVDLRRSSSVAIPADSWPAVLERVEAEVGEVGGVLRVADPEDAAFVAETVGDARLHRPNFTHVRPRVVARDETAGALP